jgi:DNA-binding MarR family transcriptional regulator
MKRASKNKTKLAAEVWRRLFDYFISSSEHRTRVLGRYELTPNDSRALHSLDRTRGRTMRELADAWACDASNATWIIDRLEARGLAERRSKPGDRRVKLVVLTPTGEKIARRVRAAMYQPSPELRSLPLDTLEELRSALEKLPQLGTRLIARRRTAVSESRSLSPTRTPLREK